MGVLTTVPSRRPPQGLSRGPAGAKLGSSARRFGGALPPPAHVIGLRQVDGMARQLSACKKALGHQSYVLSCSSKLLLATSDTTGAGRRQPALDPRCGLVVAFGRQWCQWYQSPLGFAVRLEYPLLGSVSHPPSVAPSSVMSRRRALTVSSSFTWLSIQNKTQMPEQSLGR